MNKSNLPTDTVNFIHQLYHVPGRPTHYLAGAVREEEIRLLGDLYQQHKPRRSIEWGLGSGISAATFGFIRSSLNLPGKHTVLDPFQEEVSGGWGTRCLEEFGQKEAVEFYPTFSEVFLATAREHGERFDFIFIDGAHDMGHKLTDACMANAVLESGGLLCFHDGFFKSTSTAIRFLVENENYKLLNLGYETALKRKLRGLEHSRRLGLSYFPYAQCIDFSVAILQKPG